MLVDERPTEPRAGLALPSGSPDGAENRPKGGVLAGGLGNHFGGDTTARSQVPHMALIKTSWAWVRGNPVFMRRLNGWLTILWIVMIPVSILTGWIDSVTYVAALSLWALVSGHWSAWQAARVEVAQQEALRKAEEDPVEERVVDKLVEQTTIEPTSP